jgi:HlyD family secretion protein
LQGLKGSLLQQKKMTEEDVKLMQENFASQEKMNTEKVIAPVEYRNEKSKLISKEMSLPQINSNIINNDNSQHSKQKEIAELQNQIAQQQNIFIQALQSFKAVVDDWKTKYLLISPIDGIIEFAGFVQANQQLQVNQIICFVNPKNSSYYAEVLIPQTNLGKIKINQKVMLKFPSYPFQQYGYVEGTLDFISNIPTDSGYVSKVIFVKGLNTNYHKPILFREGLKATAEIITEEMSLLNRFFYNIKSSLKKK